MAGAGSHVDLFAEQIEGAWNIPVLQAAAAMFNTTCRFIGGASPDRALERQPEGDVAAAIEGISGGFPSGYDLVLACETARRAKNVFQYIPHARKTALIVGNELRGIEKASLRAADEIVSIPMFGEGMESLNVGAAAAVALWALTKSRGSKAGQRSRRKPALPDVLFLGPTEPSEIGSTLRSAWSFGWKRAFLNDPRGVWFGRDRSTVTEGRAAARRHKNPLAVLPHPTAGLHAVEQAYLLTYDRSDAPLSRTFFPAAKDAIVIIPDAHVAADEAVRAAEQAARNTIPFHLDCPGDASSTRFRLVASVVLAEVANQHWRNRDR
jgi:hypothetical protein